MNHEALNRLITSPRNRIGFQTRTETVSSPRIFKVPSYVVRFIQQVPSLAGYNIDDATALTVIKNAHEPPTVHSQPPPSPKRRPRLCPTTQLPRYTSAFHPDRSDRLIGPSRKACVGTRADLTGATITTVHTHLTHHKSHITHHTAPSPHPNPLTARHYTALHYLIT